LFFFGKKVLAALPGRKILSQINTEKEILFFEFLRFVKKRKISLLKLYKSIH
jgi:hypothetical protein